MSKALGKIKLLGKTTPTHFLKLIVSNFKFGHSLIFFKEIYPYFREVASIGRYSDVDR